MSGARNLTQDVDIDIAGLLGEVWRKKWLVLILTVIAGALVFVTTSRIDPRYSTSARLLIEKRESVFTRRSDGDQNLSSAQFDEQAIGSQVQILTSQDLALKVIRELKLTQAPEFEKKINPGSLSTLLSIGGLAPEIAASPEERLLKEFNERLTVFAADKSRVLVVEFWANDPQLAQSVVNAMADEYIALTKAAKFESTNEATAWLGPEIDDLRTKVRTAEEKVAEFRANSDILVGNNNASLATQQLSEASSELSRLRAERSGVEAKVASIRAALGGGGSVDVIPEVIASPLIQRLRERQVSLQAEISQLSTTLLASHPRLKALKSQLNDFDAQIRSEARNILKSLENNVDVVRKQEVVLVSEVDRLKAESSRVSEAEVELRALEREATAQRDLLQSYLAQFREAASRQNRDYLPVDARIISRAFLPSESYFPKVIPFTVAGALTMMILSIVGLLVWALMSGKAFRRVDELGNEYQPQMLEMQPLEMQPLANSSSRELQQVTPPPLSDDFGIPADAVESGTNETAVPAAANDPETFDLAMVRRAISNAGDGAIAVVSPGGDAGSQVTWRLVRELARQHTVAVIDLTGSGVTSSEFLGNARGPGLYDLLAGKATVSQALYKDRLSSASIIPGMTGQQAEVELAVENLAAIIDAMRRTFDFVVLDCGYVGVAGLSGVCGPDWFVLVAANGGEGAEIRQTLRDFQARGYGDAVSVRTEDASARAIA